MNRSAVPYVLLVDDDSAVAEVYRRILEAEGYRVVVAMNGFDALEALHSCPGRPALILTDLMMPGMSGAELCQRIAAMPGLRDVPIVLLSAVADDEGGRPPLPGVRAAFCKPPEIERLLERVDDLAAAARGPAARVPNGHSPRH